MAAVLEAGLCAARFKTQFKCKHFLCACSWACRASVRCAILNQKFRIVVCLVTERWLDGYKKRN